MGAGLDGLWVVNAVLDERAGDDNTFVEVGDDETATAEPPVHVPPRGLQPVPQYADVLPHQPYCEQQFPNVEPTQVIVAPQDPSTLIDLVVEEVEEALAEEVEDELFGEVVVVGTDVTLFDEEDTIADERRADVEDFTEGEVEGDLLVEDSIIDELMDQDAVYK
jgi:hypothetical protein